MFIGHFGVGFGAKGSGTKVPLRTLFLATQFIDLLWPTLLLLGLERVEIKPGITKFNPLDFVGLILYLRVTSAKNRVGVFGLWALVDFLVMVYAGKVFGPPPPNRTVIAWTGQLQWVFVAWAYWVDRNRIARVKKVQPY
jgi:hypothetical protein